MKTILKKAFIISLLLPTFSFVGIEKPQEENLNKLSYNTLQSQSFYYVPECHVYIDNRTHVYFSGMIILNRYDKKIEKKLDLIKKRYKVFMKSYFLKNGLDEYVNEVDDNTYMNWNAEKSSDKAIKRYNKNKKSWEKKRNFRYIKVDNSWIPSLSELERL